MLTRSTTCSPTCRRACGSAARSICPPGKPEQEVYARLRDLAAKNISAEDELSFLGAGMYDHYVPALIDSILSALGVPDAVHALPARDQPGRAAGDVRVPDRDLRADRPAGLQRVGLRGPERGRRRRLARAHAHQEDALPGLRGPAPALPRDARDDLGRLGHDDRGDPARQRPHRPHRGRRRRRRRLPRPAELLRRDRGSRDALADRPRDRRAADRPGRPADARRAAPARRLRRRHLRRRGPDARQPARLRRPVVRLLRRPERATCAACRAGSRARRPTSTAAAASC